MVLGTTQDRELVSTFNMHHLSLKGLLLSEASRIFDFCFQTSGLAAKACRGRDGQLGK